MDIEQLMDDLTNPELSRYHEAAKVALRGMLKGVVVEPMMVSVDNWCDEMGLWTHSAEQKHRQALGRAATKICSHTTSKIIDLPGGLYGRPLATYPIEVLAQAKTIIEQN